MKYINLLIIILISSFLLSCGGPQKFLVKGEPGVEIYSPEMKRLGKIGSNGSVKIEIPSDDYYAFLLSKSQDSDTFVPFGLDYKTKYSFMGFPSILTGALLLVGGAGATLAGVLVENVLLLLLGPLVGMSTGGSLLGITLTVCNTLNYDYSFEYLPMQTTNQDFAFTYPDIKTFEYVSYEKEAAPNKVEASAENESAEMASSKSTKSFGSKSTKTFKDFGALLEGVYVGDGTLTINNKTIESYKGIKIDLRRIDKNHVAVQVVEANGVEFFGESSTYSIKNNGDGTYSLVHERISVATIEVDGDKQMFYFHPRVNIDGEMYALKIRADKK